MPDASAPPASSTTTTLRALVMLVCLVVIPGFALRGTPLGEKIRQFLLDKLDRPAAERAPRLDLEEAPPFAAAAPVPGMAAAGNAPYGQPSAAPWADHQAGRSPGAAASEIAPRWSSQSPGPAPIGSGWPAGAEQPSHASAVAEQPSGVVSFGGPPREGFGSPASGYPSPVVPGGGGSSGQALAAGVPRVIPGSPVQPFGEPSAPVGGPQQILGFDEGRTVDQFLYIQQRLRELGANYYLLENWGDQGEHYRFHCRVSVAGSADFTRHFECTDRDPLHAMTRVLNDVESWRQTGPAWESEMAPPIQTGQLPLGPGGSPPSRYVR